MSMAPMAPMAAARVHDLPTGAGWVFEPKFDGFRALAFCDPTDIVLQSRQQRWLTGSFPDITAALAPLADEQLALDGVIWGPARPVHDVVDRPLSLAGPRRGRPIFGPSTTGGGSATGS